MAAVESDDDLCAKTFRQGNHGGIGAAQGKVGVLFDEFADTRPIVSERSLDVKALEPSKKAGLGLRSAVTVDEISGFGHTESRDH